MPLEEGFFEHTKRSQITWEVRINAGNRVVGSPGQRPDLALLPPQPDGKIGATATTASVGQG